MANSKRTGTEPATARSPLRLRLWLAGFGVLACGVAALWLGQQARQHQGSAHTMLILLAVAALVGAGAAVVDVIVIVRRRRAGS
jgi:hypothetical protein